jgi:hypothetical protein
MATGAECHEVWERGYNEGWSVHKATRPTVPPRPEGYPSGVDPLDYYFREGYARGKNDALRTAAGMTKS